MTIGVVSVSVTQIDEFPFGDPFWQLLDTKIESLEKTEDKEKVEEIKTQANAMLENVKHAIVLLQIAKNTVHPVYGTYKKLSRNTTEQPTEFAMHGSGTGSEDLGIKDAASSEVDGEFQVDCY